VILGAERDEGRYIEEGEERISSKVRGPARFEEKSYKIVLTGLFGWLKYGFRRLAMRYERLKITYSLSLTLLASLFRGGF
jgi:hypothetical protein